MPTRRRICGSAIDCCLASSLRSLRPIFDLDQPRVSPSPCSAFMEERIARRTCVITGARNGGPQRPHKGNECRRGEGSAGLRSTVASPLFCGLCGRSSISLNHEVPPARAAGLWKNASFAAPCAHQRARKWGPQRPHKGNECRGGEGSAGLRSTVTSPLFCGLCGRSSVSLNHEVPPARASEMAKHCSRSWMQLISIERSCCPWATASRTSARA